MNDSINALFEILASLFLLINIFRIYKDKRLSGVSIIPTVFYSLWGFWNPYYYPSLCQWWSFVAGISVVITNVAWVVMAVYYRRKI